MQIIEHTPERLVIQHRRAEMAVVMVVFTLMSVVFLVNTLWQGLPRLDTLNAGQFASWAIWLVFAAGLTVLGVLMSNSAGRGTRCTFDHDAEIYRLRKPTLLRSQSDEASIYSVSHVAVERNDEVKVLGVFLVLRSGERLPLASVPFHEESDARQIAHTVRSFLLRS